MVTAIAILFDWTKKDKAELWFESSLKDVSYLFFEMLFSLCLNSYESLAHRFVTRNSNNKYNSE